MNMKDRRARSHAQMKVAKIFLARQILCNSQSVQIIRTVDTVVMMTAHFPATLVLLFLLSSYDRL
jgi:hypothetical protein